MKNVLIVLMALAAILGLAACNATGGPATGAPDYSLDVHIHGPDTYCIFAAWIEDEDGNDIQNLFVSTKEASIATNPSSPTRPLTGDCLPNWLTVKYPANTDIDGITAASIYENMDFSRDLKIGTVRKFRVCFEIDRSLNDNDYFDADRPAFTYKSALIDLDGLEAEYQIDLDGWMSNDTTGTYGQQPNTTIPGYAPYEYMTDLDYIAPWDDMVDSASVTVREN